MRRWRPGWGIVLLIEVRVVPEPIHSFCVIDVPVPVEGTILVRLAKEPLSETTYGVNENGYSVRRLIPLLQPSRKGHTRPQHGPSPPK